MKVLVRVSVLLIAAVAFVACGNDEPTGAPPPGPPSSVTAVSGSNQTGTVGEALANPIQVRVTDSNERGVPAVEVDFQVAAGGGVITASVAGLNAGSGSSAKAVVMTDANGEAEATWQLGTVVGQHSATASVETNDGEVTASFGAMAQAGPPVSLSLVSGSGQLAPIGEMLADPLVVRVGDQFDNDVPAATVDWAVTSGAGTLSAMSTQTDASGQASTMFTPSAIGSSEVTATVGSLDPAAFSAIGQAEVSDPAGDEFSTAASAGFVPPDIVRMTAWPEAGQLHVEIEFVEDVVSDDVGGPNVVAGFLDIDADQDPNTGVASNTDFFRIDGGSTGMGMDFCVIMFMGGTGTYTVADAAFNPTGTIVPFFNGKVLTMWIPLSMIGGDDGLVDLAMVVGTVPEPTDTAPVSGTLSMSASGGSNTAGAARPARPKVDRRWPPSRKE